MATSVCESVTVTEGAYLTTGQLAAALGVHIRTLRRWIPAYGLRWHHRTLGGHYRWSLATVRDQLSEAHPGGSAEADPVE